MGAFRSDRPNGYIADDTVNLFQSLNIESRARIATDHRPRCIRLLAVALTVSVLARAIAFVSQGHSLDDLRYWELDGYGLQELWLHGAREGRFAYPWLAQFSEFLGVTLPRSPTLSAFALSLCLGLSGIAICYLWRIERDRPVSALVVAVFVSHPYYTDIFLWKMAMFTGGIPFAVALFSMLLARQSWIGAFLGVPLLVSALAVHQLPLSVCSGVWLVAVAFDFIREEGKLSHKHLIQSARIAVTLLVGTLVYLAVAKMIIHAIGMQSVNNRDVLIAFSYPKLVMHRAIELLSMMLYRDPIVAPLVRIILAAVLTFTFVPHLIRSLVSRNWAAFAAVVLFPPTLVGVALLACVLTVVPEAWVPSYRNLTGVSVIWAAVLAAVALSPRNRTSRLVATVGGSFILFAFIGTSNEMLSDQQRQSERDKALMGQIAGRLAAIPGFSTAENIGFSGTNSDPLSGLSTAADISHGWGEYGSTFSVFAASFGEEGYLYHLYEEVTGDRRFRYSDKATTKAREICRSAPAWPNPTSVALHGTLAVICLGPPTEVTPTPFSVPVS